MRPPPREGPVAVRRNTEYDSALDQADRHDRRLDARRLDYHFLIGKHAAFADGGIVPVPTPATPPATRLASCAPRER